VCTTEIGAAAKAAPDFEKLNCKFVGISVDSAESHVKWIEDVNETQKCQVAFPMVADADRKIADLYGMIAPNAPDTLAGKLTVRSVFFVTPARKLMCQLTYPASTGRSFPELMRVLRSLQLTVNSGVATPANWQEGGDVVVVPSISTEDAKVKFPKGITEIKPYLRMTPQPDV
jgi:alkyl hydroperoxide reductase subunit AhpC